MKHVVKNLVTVLLAFGIIFVLFLTLVPIHWGSSRLNAQRASCQTNLKQISLALNQYRKDYDGRFPRYNVRNVGVTEEHGLVGNYWVQALHSYSLDLRTFQCPSEGNSLGTDYYYSRVVSGHSKQHFLEGYRTVVFTEGPDTTDASLAVAVGPNKNGSPPSYARHLDGSNYAFVDGHVKWFQSSRPPTNIPASQGGFTFHS